MASFNAACGGDVGMASFKVVCGGEVGMASGNAKADVATAQPATKAIRLSFMMIAPCGLLRNAADLTANKSLPA